MATCNVTLDLAHGGDQPYASGSIQVGRAVPADSTTGFVDGSLESVPLTNPPTVLGLNGYQPLERETVYLFVGPTGIRYYKMIPDAPEADFSDLIDAVPVVDPGGSGYLADDLMAEVAADPDSDFRQELDEIFAASAGDIADGAVAALVNSGPDTKAALGDEMDDASSPLSIATVDKVAAAAAVQLPTFSPHDYGAVGDGVADDTAAILAAIEAAYTRGGGNVQLEHKDGSKYRFTDPIVLKARVNLIGSTVSHTSDVCTLIADSATATLWFGQWVGGHEFGGFSGGFLVDGNGSGDPDGLVRFQCVQRSFGQIRVKDGAGHNAVIDNAQNNSFVGLDTDHAADSALVLDNGCGGNVFTRCEIGSSDVALTVTDDPAVTNAYPFGPAHNEFHHCIFENYANGTELINMEAGQTRFNGCGFAINDPFTVSSDVMIRISNPLWPTIPTAGEFTSAVFNGGTLAQTNAFAIDGANRIILNGDSYFFAHPHIFGVTGENPYVVINGPLQTFEVGALFDLSGTGTLYNFRHVETLPTLYRQHDDLDPFGVFNFGRPGDALDAHRFVLNRDGGMSWSPGEFVAVGSIVYNDTDRGLTVGGRMRTADGVAKTIETPVVDVGGEATVFDSKAGSVFELILYGSPASVSLSNPVDGAEVAIRVYGVGANWTVNWAANFRFAGGVVPTSGLDAYNEIRFRYHLGANSGAGLWLETGRVLEVPYV